MNLPLFPLGTVLFPGGVLPLRIFETRYLDMVRACMASDSPFGVCLITKGAEVGSPAEHHPIGCTARIVDFGMEPGGVLQLRTVGLERFTVIDRSTQPDGLIRATVRVIAADPALPVPQSLAACSTLMRQVIDDLCKRESDPAERMLAEPFLPEDAAWVSNRLCELLPLAPDARQGLMVLDNPLERLTRVAQILASLRTS
jgi:Lon protease-like protein